MVALDDYFQPGQRVDLIKLDIQGYELNALRGAKRVLQENPDIQLLFELWPYGLNQAGATWVELIDTLRAENMAVFRVTKHQLVPFCSQSVREGADWYVNLFASHK
jgi:hypothetical protein